MVPHILVERRKPSLDLEAFKAVCGDPLRLNITKTALVGAASAGIDMDGVAAVVRAMERSHFHKSMTAYNDHRHWQDVYHVPWEGMVLYVKFTDDVLSEFLVLSFKER
jgi:motility quorum-sensing regulator/GCU-specific mRNA interferase toxin